MKNVNSEKLNAEKNLRDTESQRKRQRHPAPKKITALPGGRTLKQRS